MQGAETACPRSRGNGREPKHTQTARLQGLRAKPGFATALPRELGTFVFERSASDGVFASSLQSQYPQHILKRSPIGPICHRTQSLKNIWDWEKGHVWAPSTGRTLQVKCINPVKIISIVRSVGLILLRVRGVGSPK